MGSSPKGGEGLVWGFMSDWYVAEVALWKPAHLRAAWLWGCVPRE